MKAALLSPAQHAARLEEKLQLAVQIADEAAATQLRSYGMMAHGGWLSMAPRPGQSFDDGVIIAKALRYLRLRDRIEVHPDHDYLIRVTP